jgi:anti-anti-sigma regulatory factor
VSSNPVSTPLADNPVNELEVPLIPKRLSPEGPLSLDDVESLDELLSPGFCACQVALSLADLKSVDSRRISWLAAVHKRFCEEGGKLVVHSVWPPLMEALRFLRLDQVLHVAEDEAAALRLLHQSEPVAAG